MALRPGTDAYIRSASGGIRIEDFVPQTHDLDSETDSAGSVLRNLSLDPRDSDAEALRKLDALRDIVSSLGESPGEYDPLEVVAVLGSFAKETGNDELRDEIRGLQDLVLANTEGTEGTESEIESESESEVSDFVEEPFVENQEMINSGIPEMGDEEPVKDDTPLAPDEVLIGLLVVSSFTFIIMIYGIVISNVPYARGLVKTMIFVSTGTLAVGSILVNETTPEPLFVSYMVFSILATIGTLVYKNFEIPSIEFRPPEYDRNLYRENKVNDTVDGGMRARAKEYMKYQGRNIARPFKYIQESRKLGKNVFTPGGTRLLLPEFQNMANGAIMYYALNSIVMVTKYTMFKVNFRIMTEQYFLYGPLLVSGFVFGNSKFLRNKAYFPVRYFLNNILHRDSRKEGVTGPYATTAHEPLNAIGLARQAPIISAGRDLRRGETANPELGAGLVAGDLNTDIKNAQKINGTSGLLEDADDYVNLVKEALDKVDGYKSSDKSKFGEKERRVIRRIQEVLSKVVEFQSTRVNDAAKQIIQLDLGTIGRIADRINKNGTDIQKTLNILDEAYLELVSDKKIERVVEFKQLKLREVKKVAPIINKEDSKVEREEKQNHLYLSMVLYGITLP